MKNKIKLINQHLSEKGFDQFWVESFSKKNNSLMISFESLTGGEYENETLITEFKDVDYFSLPRSFQSTNKISLKDETDDFINVFKKLNIDYNEICDVKENGKMYNKLIRLNISPISCFYIVFSDITAWMQTYPENKKILIT